MTARGHRRRRRPEELLYSLLNLDICGADVGRFGLTHHRRRLIHTRTDPDGRYSVADSSENTTDAKIFPRKN